jgi:bla regulator protein blaR1
MIANLAHLWPLSAQGIADHLWQSTLFALAAALLTLALRKNHARHRYALWLAASLKFLVPFSLLATIGSRLSFIHPSASLAAGMNLVAAAAAQPFSPAGAEFTAASAVTAAPEPFLLLPALLLSLWLCGVAFVLLASVLRWRRIAAVVRSATPLREGREFFALRRIERIIGARGPIEIRASSASLEPGICGIARPVLLWPRGISGCLSDAQIEAIIAHELSHVRRRDNLAAAIHMLVEAIFWFHPLVWWIGKRLVAERERACDEQVLEFGSERAVYAESILKTCEFCSGFSLACVSGVTGADLERRIIRVMTQRASRKIGGVKQFLLGATALLALALPISFGLSNAAASHALEGMARPIISHAAAIAQRAAIESVSTAIPVSKSPVPKQKICPKVLAARKAAAAAAAAAVLKSETQRAPG